MSTQPLSGILPILATPFTASGEIDEDSFRRQIELSIQDGVDGIGFFGLASEYYKLADAERDRLARVTVAVADGRVPVILSVTRHSRELAVKEAQTFESVGASALMVMPPFFLSPSENDVLAHIEAICAHVAIPVIAQYAPIQTGCSLAPEAFARIAAEYPNFHGVKVDTSPAGPYVSSLRRTSDRIACYVGYLGLHLPEAVEHGAAGCMPSAALNRAFVRLWRLLRSDADAGRQFHQRLLPLTTYMMQNIEFLIACEKRLLVRRRIFESAYCRRPAVSMDAAQERKLDELAAAWSGWLPEAKP